MMALGASSLFGQVERGAVIARPDRPTTLRKATLVQPPAAPTNLTVTPAATEASLRWDPVPGATGYRVTRMNALYGSILQTPNPITSTSFTDVSQQFNPRYLYTYSVYAVHPDGRAGIATVTYLPAPASVSRPQHVGNRYAVGWAGWNTTWTAVPEATGYVVRYQLWQTNGWNVYRTVDSSIVVAAPTTTHYVGEYNGLQGFFGTVLIKSSAVSAVFANGARSAATPAP
jgi:hypothetical protein